MDVAVQPAMLTREGGSKVTVFRSRDGERGIDTSITKFESPAKLDLISCNSFLGKFTPHIIDQRLARGSQFVPQFFRPSSMYRSRAMSRDIGQSRTKRTQQAG